MKTSTLILRLIGLYLLTKCSLGLLHLKKAQAMVGPFGGSSGPMVEELRLYLWLGLVLVMGATLFAGPLARLLTFDSGTTERHLGCV